MLHFTYITASSSGLYYVGRHSTKNVNDGYQGSGVWVTACKKNKVELHTKILNFYSTFEELQLAEECLIKNNINSKSCMNFNNRSVGFAIGELNPAKRKEVIAKRPQNNKGYENNHFKYDNPSKKDYVKKIRSEKAQELWNDISYRDKLSGENHYMSSPERKENFSKNNPMHNTETVQKIRNRVMESVKNGTHNSKSLLQCPHCNKTCSIPNAKRWHFDKCKKLKFAIL